MTTTPINPEEELPAGEHLEQLETDERTDAERERDEYKDGWMRAKADLINHKKQEMERVSRAVSAGMTSMVEDLLLVLDSFGIAIAASAGTPAEQGMQMIRGQFLDVLKRYGVEPIPQADLVGKEFDPAVAEAIGFVPASSHPDGTVDSVVQDGYRMQGTVVRPARVNLAQSQ